MTKRTGLSWRYGCWYWNGKEVDDSFVGQLVADLQAQAITGLDGLRDVRMRLRAMTSLPQTGTGLKELKRLIEDLNKVIGDLVERKGKYAE